MSERFLTFDEAQQLLKIPADELQRRMDGTEIHAVVEDGVVKFSEIGILKLADPSAGAAEPSALPRPDVGTGQDRRKQDDYGFIFLVDEEQETAIEGEAYDGELPTGVLEIPEEISSDELITPTDLSSEQTDALELFSEMDMSKVVEVGRKVAERVEDEGTLLGAEEPTASDTIGAGLEVPEMPGEPFVEPPAEPPVVSPAEPVEPTVEQEVVAEAAVGDTIGQDVAEKTDELEFVTDEMPASSADLPSAGGLPAVQETELPDELAEELDKEIEVTGAYELAEAVSEVDVTEHAERATDEEQADLPREADLSVEPEPEPIETAEQTAEGEEEPTEVSLREVEAEIDAEFEAELEEIELPTIEESVEVPVEAEEVAAEEIVTEEVAAEPVEPEPVESASSLPAEEMKVPDLSAEIELESDEEVELPVSTVMSEDDAGELFDEIEKEIEQEDAVEVSAKEEISVSEEETRTPEEKKSEEDVFEVYDLDEETEEGADQAPEVEAVSLEAEAAEEIVELEEVSAATEERDDIEKSVEDEMAELFGETTAVAAGAAVVEAGTETDADDFDLSIFKEADETVQDIGALEETAFVPADVEATDTFHGSDDEAMTIPAGGPSRIDAITAPKGPSTAPFTIAILVAFAALIVGGMAIIALYYMRSPV